MDTQIAGLAIAEDRPQRQALRVLSVIPGEEEGPTMIFAKRQAASLVEAGVVGQTFYLTSRTAPGALLRERRRLSHVVREFQPDLIHAHFGTMTGFFCAYGTRVPLVITYRGSDLNPTPSNPRLRSWCGHALSHLAARRAKGIICVSAELRDRLKWGRNCARVIPTGVDTSCFFPRDRDATRAELGWPTDARIVLFNAGRSPKVKRLDLATAAVEVARKHIGEIRFEVLDGYVRADRIPLMMNAADCLVFTSDWEGAPTVIQEALACNLPIVSVPVGDVPERLEGVTPSRLVARDADALGEALADILTSRPRSNGWTAAQQLSLSALREHVMDVYRMCLDSHGQSNL